MTHRPRHAWVRARDVLEKLLRLQSPSGARVELGRVTYVGEGLYRTAYAAAVEAKPDANALSRAWVVLLPRDDVDDDDESHASPSQELQLLAALHANESLPFRVPRPLGALPGPTGTVLVREYVRGIPLDLRAGRQGIVRPWEIVAKISAALHGIATYSLAQPLQAGPATRREHARLMLQSLESLPQPEARASIGTTVSSILSRSLSHCPTAGCARPTSASRFAMAQSGCWSMQIAAEQAPSTNAGYRQAAPPVLSRALA